MTAWSYLDQVHVSAIACRDVLPDLGALLAAMEAALVELEESLGTATPAPGTAPAPRPA